MSKLRYALELVRDVLTEQLGKVLCMTCACAQGVEWHICTTHSVFGLAIAQATAASCFCATRTANPGESSQRYDQVNQNQQIE